MLPSPPSPQSVTSRYKWLLPLLMFALAAVLRWVMAVRSGLSCDEALCLFVASLPKVADTLGFLRLHESHPPLFYLLLRAWMTVFGSSDKAVLLLPVLAGSLSAVVVYAATRHIGGRRAAVIAATLVCVSPGLLDYSAQVRPYALLHTLTPLSCFLLWQIRQGALALPRWIGWSLLSLSLVYLHNWGWILVGAQALCFCLTGFAQPSGKSWLSPLAGLMLSIGGIVLFYLPWLPTLIYQARFAGYGGLTRSQIVPKVTGALFSLLEFTTQTRLGTTQKRAILVWSIVGVFLWVALRQKTGSDNAPARPAKPWIDALLLFGGTAAVALSMACILSVQNDLLQPKSLSALLPGVYLVLGMALSRLLGAATTATNRKLHARILLQLSAFLTFVLIGLSLCQQNYEQFRSAKSSAREYASFVAENAKVGDLIVIVPEWFCSSFNWYYKGDVAQICYPAQQREERMAYDHVVERFLSPEPFVQTQRRLEQARRQGSTIWLLTLPQLDSLPERAIPVTPTLRAAGRSYMPLGLMRAQQLHSYLTQLYGPGETILPRPVGSDESASEVELHRFAARPLP